MHQGMLLFHCMAKCACNWVMGRGVGGISYTYGQIRRHSIITTLATKGMPADALPGPCSMGMLFGLDGLYCTTHHAHGYYDMHAVGYLHMLHDLHGSVMASSHFKEATSLKPMAMHWVGPAYSP